MNFFIKSPLKKGLSTSFFLVCIVCFWFIFYFKPFYVSQPDITKNDALLDETLRHLMIRHHGIYTLFGVKPITLFLDGDGHVDREKEMEEFLQFPHKTQKKIRRIKTKEYREMPRYLKEKYSKKDVFFSDYHWDEIWQFWEENWGKYTGDKYFFLIGDNSKFGRLFVNVNEVIYCLHRYYSDFKKTNGKDFSPDEVLEELRQGDSEFWGKVFEDHFLTGILLGYGEKSSFLFHLKSNEKFSPLYYVVDLNKNGWNLHRAYLNVSDLAIPSIKLFSLYDEQISIFREERDHIIDFYSGEDFVGKTLSILKQKEHTLIDVVSGKIIPTKCSGVH